MPLTCRGFWKKFLFNINGEQMEKYSRYNNLFEMPHNQQIIMHVDMNSYFASCEQQANAAWRGRPLGVCSYLHPKGTIIAASKEAKKLGVKVGTKLQEAQNICPSIVLVRDDPAKYRAITHTLRGILQSYTFKVEHYSIDESFLYFDKEKSINEISAIAYKIKERIQKEAGDWLTCSIGIAGTKFFAKVASDIKKPDGLIVINDKNVDERLSKMRLTDIWGISYGLEKQLNRLGVFTPLELKYVNAAFLLKNMGKNGYFLWSRLNGLEIDQIKIDKETNQKSVGNSYTLLEKTRDKDKVALLLMKMTEKIGRRLRKKNMQAKVLWIGWKYLYGGGFARREKLAEASNDSWELFQHVFGHLQRKILHDKISKIFINVSGLEKSHELQLSIFEDKIKKIQLSESLDKINDKYGEFTISRGAWHNWSEQINDRISFGKMQDE